VNRPSLIAGLVLLASPLTATLHAQGASARGATIWIRSGGGSATELVGSVFAAPQFVIGERGDRFAFGVGLGFTRASENDEDEWGIGSRSEEKLTATLFQAGPEFLLDMWRSSDGRTRGNIGGGVSVGRVSIVEESMDTYSGQTQRSESRSSGTLVTVRLGVGGDHFLDRHFALGLEAGVRATVALDIQEKGVPGNRIGFSAAGTYAALRAQVVFGR